MLFRESGGRHFFSGLANGGTDFSGRCPGFRILYDLPGHHGDDPLAVPAQTRGQCLLSGTALGADPGS